MWPADENNCPPLVYKDLILVLDCFLIASCLYLTFLNVLCELCELRSFRRDVLYCDLRFYCDVRLQFHFHPQFRCDVHDALVRLEIPH